MKFVKIVQHDPSGRRMVGVMYRTRIVFVGVPPIEPTSKCRNRYFAPLAKLAFQTYHWVLPYLPEGTCLHTCMRSGPLGPSTISSRNRFTSPRRGGMHASIAASESSGRSGHSVNLPCASCCHRNVAHLSSGSSPEAPMSGITCSFCLRGESLFSVSLSASGRPCILPGSMQACPDTPPSGIS
jgi:hypothetical protein